MSNPDNRYWKKIGQLGIFSMVFPFLIMFAGIILANRVSDGLVKNYEQGAARIVQYVLFAIGIMIFFFCDGISDFFANRLFVADRQRKDENLSSYFAYVFILMWLLNMISVMGFVGFLICGNLTWLALFVILTLSLQMRYFPSRKRFEKLIELAEK